MAQKLQTLFDDLADNIERLADYETQTTKRRLTNTEPPKTPLTALPSSKCAWKTS